MAEIRMLRTEEIPQAAELAQGVFGFDLRQTITDPQMIRYFEEYAAAEHLTDMASQKKLYLWGIFESEQLCGMSAMQPEGHITMLYVYPYFRRKRFARQLLDAMRRFAKQSLGLERVTACAFPAWTALYFIKNGFWQLPMQPAAGAGQPATGTDQSATGAGQSATATGQQTAAPGFVYVEAKSLKDVVYPVRRIPRGAFVAAITLTLLAIIAVIAAYFGLYGAQLL